jgi:hypothetical protein
MSFCDIFTSKPVVEERAPRAKYRVVEITAKFKVWRIDTEVELRDGTKFVFQVKSDYDLLSQYCLSDKKVCLISGRDVEYGFNGVDKDLTAVINNHQPYEIKPNEPYLDPKQSFTYTDSIGFKIYLHPDLIKRITVSDTWTNGEGDAVKMTYTKLEEIK